MVSKRKRMRLIWRKMGLLKLAFLAAIIVILFFLMFLFVDTESNYTSTNILVFIVVNLNIIALGVMTFLIGRNITKLFFDRKNKVSGAKLRSRLVLAFVGMTLVPTCLVFLIASKILSTAIDRWFYSQTESLYTSAVDVAKFHYHSISEHASLIAQWISDEIKSNQDKYKIPSELHAFLEAERKQNKVFTIALYNRSHQKIDYVYNVVATIPDLADPQPDEEYLSQAFDSLKPIDNLESLGANKFVRVYFPVKWYKQDLLLLITMRLNPELSTKLMLIDDAYREHEQLKFYNRPIQSGYLLTLSMITALIIFSAIWIGFYIAREITNPIKKLAEGTRAIAKGDYDFKLRERGDDEVSSLVKAFNIMTRDLKASRVEVEMRRLYLESILARLAVAVIALDKDGNVNSFNQAAIRLFDLSNDVYNVHLHELLSPVELAQIEALLRCIDDESVHASEREMEILTNGRLRKVIATAGSIVDSNGVRLGSVLVFDDITELVQAQQSAAWNEVARRIAHEIKNPLTPIQLSAQRLQKILTNTEFEERARESTQMILEHVSSIKRLVDEFAKFSRMPPVEMRMLNLNDLISEILSSLVEQNNDAIFQFIVDNSIPELPLDREQIRRALLNLIDNGLAACRDDPTIVKRGGTRIVLKTGLDSKRGIVTLEVSDNGPGIPRDKRTKIFEPYMTTKVGGTGLGLPIVASIIAEHHAEIKVLNNSPQGTRFIIELKIFSQGDKVRRLKEV